MVVTDPAAVHSEWRWRHVDVLTVGGGGDDRLFFAAVGIDDGGVPREVDHEAFTLRTDDDEYRLAAVTGDDWSPVGLPLGLVSKPTALRTPVPAPMETSAAAVVFDDGPRWTLPESTLDRLRSPPPSFRVRAAIPDEVRPDGSLTVTVEVTNEGGPGTFRAVVSARVPGRFHFDRIRVSLGPGESATRTVRPIDYSEPDSTIDVGVDTPDRDISVEVRVLPDSGSG